MNNYITIQTSKLNYANVKILKTDEIADYSMQKFPMYQNIKFTGLPR